MPAVPGAALPARLPRHPARRLPLEQAFGPQCLYVLRAAVQAYAAATGMPGARAEDVKLAVHELAANAIQHGTGHGRLRMWQQNGSLHCQVDDDGPRGPAAQDPAGPGGNAAARWPRVRPHGLWLVYSLADQVTITSGTARTRAIAVFTVPAGHGVDGKASRGRSGRADAGGDHAVGDGRPR